MRDTAAVSSANQQEPFDLENQAVLITFGNIFFSFPGLRREEQEDPLLGAAGAARREHGGHAQGAREADPAGRAQGASREGEDQQQAPLLNNEETNWHQVGEFHGHRPEHSFPCLSMERNGTEPRSLVEGEHTNAPPRIAPLGVRDATGRAFLDPCV